MRAAGDGALAPGIAAGRHRQGERKQHQLQESWFSCSNLRGDVDSCLILRFYGQDRAINTLYDL